MKKGTDDVMKKLYAFLMVTLLVIGLCACSLGHKSGIYTVDMKGMVFTVDTENSTISDGVNLYHYTVSGNSSGADMEITYPDGSIYWWSTQTSGAVTSGYGGWSDDYDDDRYVPGDVLCDVLETREAKPDSEKNWLLIFALAAVGMFHIISPYTAWYLEYGWRYRNAEPSEMALGFNRLGGAAALILAIIMFFV